MAEAFGLAAGVLQVAGFGAEVGSTLWKCAKKFRNARKELEAIAGQVEMTALSLRRVDALLRDPATKALHTPKLYEDTSTVSDGCHGVFCELDNIVKSFESKSGVRRMTVFSKTRFLFDSSKLQELGLVLCRYSDVLHLMVSVMAIVEGRRAATKDEIQALEVDLQHLAISNRDLAHSNKTLTDTIAAISQAPISSVEPRTKVLPAVVSVVDLQSDSKDMHVNSLISMPPVSLPPVIRRRPVLPTPVADHLLLCMKSVQELATTISSALGALHGQEKTGSSDVHGSYAKLSANLQRLPAGVQCVHCARSVAWPRLEPIPPDLLQVGACICMCQSSPSIWKPCDTPTEEGEVGGLAIFGPMAKIAHRRSQSPDAAIYDVGMHELNRPATKDFSDEHPGVGISPEAPNYIDSPATHPETVVGSSYLSRMPRRTPQRILGARCRAKSDSGSADTQMQGPPLQTHYEPLPVEPNDESDKVTYKRARNTTAARESRARMVEDRETLASSKIKAEQRTDLGHEKENQTSPTHKLDLRPPPTADAYIQQVDSAAPQSQTSRRFAPAHLMSGPPLVQQEQINTSPYSGINTGNKPHNANPSVHWSQAQQQQAQQYQARQQQAQQQQAQPQSQRVQDSMGFGYDLNLDIADVSAGGGDVLDNFDFDSFLNTEETDQGFEDIAFEKDPEAEDTDMHSILAQPSQVPLDAGAGAGALGAEAFLRARSVSRSSKARSRSSSRSRRESGDKLRRRRSESRARSESPAGQLGKTAATAAVVGGLAANARRNRRQSDEAVIANDSSSPRPRSRHHSRDAKQHPPKRSRSDAFPSYEEDYAAFEPPSMSSHLSAAPVRHACRRRGRAPTRNDSGKMSMDSPSALQALLDRWLDAGATAVLLESSLKPS